MNVPDLLQNLSDRLQTSASVKSVFGEPVTLGDRIVIPVARIAYGFGGGGGSAHAKGPLPENEGGGGGGGFAAKPAGIVEISPAGTCFMAFPDGRRICMALAAGIALGWMAGRRRH
jgi:uncharacterized spore protein YtfJ